MCKVSECEQDFYFICQANLLTYRYSSCVNHSSSHVLFFISLVLIITPLKHKIVKMKWDAKKLFQILPFYNTLIKKPEIKKIIKHKVITRTSIL